MLNEGSQKTKNKKRDTGKVLQLHMQLPKELSKSIDAKAKEKGMTKAGWVTYTLDSVIRNGGTVTPAAPDVTREDIDNINNKLDTITNLLSSIIAQSSAR